MNKSLEKEIDYLRDAKNNLWTAFLGAFGGSIGLVFIGTKFFLFKWVAVFVGFASSVVFLDNYFRKGDKIESILKILKKKGE